MWIKGSRAKLFIDRENQVSLCYERARERVVVSLHNKNSVDHQNI